MKINFIKLTETIRDPNLKPMEKVLLVNLWLYANTEGETFPSQYTLAKDLDCTPRYIRDCLVALRNNSILKSWTRRGFSKSNSYKFNEELYFRNGSTLRNSSSYHSGTTEPQQSGSTVPTNKVNKESNITNINIEKLIKSYEKAFGLKCHSYDKNRIAYLCNKYGYKLVKETMIECHERFLEGLLSYMTVGYLIRVLDEKANGNK